jgi:NitT/TauT family transport system ATP-binding protein
MGSTVSTPQQAAGVALQRISRRFSADVLAIDQLNLQVPAGQFLAILGPSGCGKSTLLRLVAGLDRPTSGTITLHGEDGPVRPATAFAFQDAHLLPWRNVWRNVALPLELMRVSAPQRRQAALQALAQVGLGDAADRYPNQLSGGMRMRVSLARALVTDPQVLLLDEPFAALDEITRHRLDEQLHQLWQRRGLTVLFVTHSTAEAVFLAQRAVVLSQRPARLVADVAIGLPEPRTAALRGEAEFAAYTRTLYQALRQGGPP